MSPTALPQTPEARPDSTLGLYVHFPWCLRKCPYCDFLSIGAESQDVPRERYTDQVIREIEQRREHLGPVRIASVFFGGGTPSLWGVEGIARVLEEFRRSFNLAETNPEGPEVEITVECNPTSFSREFGEALRAAGVGRVSLGVQSLDDERLRFLGRLHDARGGLKAVEQALEAGLPEVSADLIFGVAGQSTEAAVDEVRQIARLGVHHLSAYALTIEPGTQFGALHRKGRLPLLPEETVAASFVAVEAALAELGLEHYEVSNYARPGHEARHNLGYWTGRDYLGLGTGAWGTLTLGGEVLRYRNTPAVERYFGTVTWPVPSPATTGPGTPYQEIEHLTPEMRLHERLMLGLRLASGVHLPSVLDQLGLPAMTPRQRGAIARLTELGRLHEENGWLRIPRSQWLFADGIVAKLISGLS